MTRAIRLLRDRIEIAQNAAAPTPAETAASAAFGDRFAASLLRDGAQEARDWLARGESTRTLGEFASTASSIRFVSQLVRAGALAAWAVQIDRYPDGTENTGRIVVELPDNREARAKILARLSRKSKAMGAGPIEDAGQKYVFLMLD
jgi:hypothetical protein